MVLDEAPQRRGFRRVLDRLDVHHLGVQLRAELARLVEHVGDAARHAGREVAPGLAEHRHRAAGHVLAAVVAGAFHHRGGAGQAHREALARDAVEIGRACARNNLLKCALHGEDPNWGRILAAIGTTNAVLDPYNIDVTLNGVKVCEASSPGQSRDLVNMKNELIEIVIDLHMGSAMATIWTNDLTHDYVHENSAYAS